MLNLKAQPIAHEILDEDGKRAFIEFLDGLDSAIDIIKSFRWAKEASPLRDDVIAICNALIVQTANAIKNEITDTLIDKTHTKQILLSMAGYGYKAEAANQFSARAANHIAGLTNIDDPTPKQKAKIREEEIKFITNYLTPLAEILEDKVAKKLDTLFETHSTLHFTISKTLTGRSAVAFIESLQNSPDRRDQNLATKLAGNDPITNDVLGEFVKTLPKDDQIKYAEHLRKTADEAHKNPILTSQQNGGLTKLFHVMSTPELYNALRNDRHLGDDFRAAADAAFVEREAQKPEQERREFSYYNIEHTNWHKAQLNSFIQDFREKLPELLAAATAHLQNHETLSRKQFFEELRPVLKTKIEKIYSEKDSKELNAAYNTALIGIIREAFDSTTKSPADPETQTPQSHPAP